MNNFAYKLSRWRVSHINTCNFYSTGPSPLFRAWQLSSTFRNERNSFCFSVVVSLDGRHAITNADSTYYMVLGDKSYVWRLKKRKLNCMRKLSRADHFILLIQNVCSIFIRTFLYSYYKNIRTFYSREHQNFWFRSVAERATGRRWRRKKCKIVFILRRGEHIPLNESPSIDASRSFWKNKNPSELPFLVANTIPTRDLHAGLCVGLFLVSEQNGQTKSESKKMNSKQNELLWPPVSDTNSSRLASSLFHCMYFVCSSHFYFCDARALCAFVGRMLLVWCLSAFGTKHKYPTSVLVRTDGSSGSATVASWLFACQTHGRRAFSVISQRNEKFNYGQNGPWWMLECRRHMDET